MQNNNIFILGSSGQIGKELSVNLKKNNSINLYCHARNSVSSEFFVKNNINVVIGDLNDTKIKDQINKSDLIFDLAAPNSGSLSEIKKFYANRLEIILNNMKKNSIFILASTMNAFGLSNNRKKLKNYLLPSSIYSANKRYAEKFCKNLGNINSINTFIIRLSEVHGSTQRATENLKKLIYYDYVFEIPNSPAWITFVSSLEEALISILRGKEIPSTYTLVSDEIYWIDLLKFLGKKINKNIKYKYCTNSSKNFLDIVNNLINNNKDFIRGNIEFSKEFEENFKLKHRLNKSKKYLEMLDGVNIYRDLNKYTGVLPGKRFKNITKNKNQIFINETQREKNFLNNS